MTSPTAARASPPVQSRSAAARAEAKAFFVEQRFMREGELWASALVRLRALDKQNKPVDTSAVLPVLDASGVKSPPLPEWVTAWMQAQGALRNTIRPVRAA